jgi:hypothetical protein
MHLKYKSCGEIGQIFAVIAAIVAPVHAQISPVNSRLFAALEDYRAAGRDNSGALIQLRARLAQRHQELRNLISSDPGAVLAAAVPDDVRGAVPADVRDLVERHVKIQGEMEVTIEDGPGYSRTHYGLRVAGKRLTLHFADRPPAGLLTGTPVQAEGVQVGEELALTSGGAASGSTVASAAILPNTFGAQKTLVILVNFQDVATQPYTPATASSVTFATVSSFFRNNSLQQTWLTGDVAGWYTIPVLSTSCDTASIQKDAQQAAQSAGYVLANYNRFVYAFPQTSACTWWGLSYVGGNPSSSWINGNYQLQVVGHELGHAFGLYHSHSLSCGTGVYATSGCAATEYGDTFDIMGNISAADYNAAQREMLGWLNYGAQPPITTVSTSGTYSLAPYETQDNLPKSLKIAGPNGTYYYVETRQGMGDDSFLSGFSNVITGVLLHNETPGSPNSSYLLNATPGGSWYSPALDVGQSYTDSSVGVTITPLSVSTTGASVQVSFGSVPCARANPSISITGPAGSVAAGAAAVFTVAVKDNDSSSCSSSAFGLSSSVPAGWTAAYSSGSVTLAPGAGGSVTLQVTAPAGASNGTYTVSASTSNTSASSYTAAASVSETIYTAPACTHANPSISMSGPSGPVAPGASANFAVTITNRDSSACSASLFTLADSAPSGWTAAYSTGSVTLAPAAISSVTLQVTAPAGTPNGGYTVAATVSNSSNPSYTASASASETIYAPAQVTVAVRTNQSSYTAGQKVSISVTVMNGSVPAAGASVSVKITKSNSNVVTVSGTTASNGVAVVSYQVKKNDPKGAWQAIASSGNTSASTGFTVQ